MEKLRLGRTGMMVSKLGFGGIPIQRLSDEEAVAVVKRCVELGITFLDTANGYTTSEERIGQAIKEQREKLIIATKTGARNREGVEAHLKLSLQHLGVDYIDLYQFHGVSDFKNLDMVLEPNGPLVAVQEAKKAGLVKHIGITSHSMDVAKKAVQSDRFETIMFPFNFITHEAAEELLPLARKHDVGFIAMKPLAGGMLDNAMIAFKYLFQFPDVVPIPGIEKIREIEEIVGILKKTRKMTAAELREMQRLRQELGSRFCHRCDYCQPCTAEIPISTVLTSRSFAKRLPPERFFSSWIGTGIERAADCTECGDCETRCPYHLPIREMLAEHVKWYQDEKKRYDELLATRGTGKVRP
jgi:predicted aldo/keto reductase-like oxidoreductase